MAHGGLSLTAKAMNSPTSSHSLLLRTQERSTGPIPAPAARQKPLESVDDDDLPLHNLYLGFSGCDRLLRLLSQRLQDGLPSNARLSHPCRQQFAVLLEPSDDAVDAVWLAASLIDRLHTPVAMPLLMADSHYPPLHVDVSIGISPFAQGGTCAATVMQQATSALQRARSTGSGSVSTFTRAAHAAEKPPCVTH
jgi:GGDEF domain-containing protein